MIRSIVRAVTFGAAALGTVVVAQAATATAFTFDFTKSSYEGASQSFSSTNGSTLNLKATAWHANDSAPSALSSDSISSATLGLYSGAGMGVLFGNDTGSNGTHQIDNVGGGADFVMLQFSQAVTLDGIYRNVYSIAGANCCDSDAAYWGDTTALLGPASSTASIDLTKYQISESLFTDVSGGGSGGSTGLGTTKAASVWLVSAAFNQSNDAFKLAGLQASTSNPAPAVPEPASWALMIVGFGAIGVSMRRRKAATLATA